MGKEIIAFEIISILHLLGSECSLQNTKGKNTKTTFFEMMV